MTDKQPPADNTPIRIQGRPGRLTQMLRDGRPAPIVRTISIRSGAVGISGVGYVVREDDDDA